MGLYKTPPASTSSTTPTIPTKVIFEDITVSFSKEANHQSGHLKLVRPGSEYANAASHSHLQQAPSVNPTTGVRVHKQNPKGIVCDNPVCTGLPHSMTHDREHCMQQGGGMEGKAPWHNKTNTPPKKKEIAAAATESAAASNTNTLSSSTSTESEPWQHLACVVIEEVDDASSPSHAWPALCSRQSLTQRQHQLLSLIVTCSGPLPQAQASPSKLPTTVHFLPLAMANASLT